MSTSGVPDSTVAFWSAFLDRVDSTPRFLANEECLEPTSSRSFVSRSVSSWRGEHVLYEVTKSDVGRPFEKEVVFYVTATVGDHADGTRLGAMGNQERADGETQIDNKTTVKLVIAGKGFDAAEEGGDAQDLWQDQKVGFYDIEHLFVGGRASWDELNQDASVALRSFVKQKSGPAAGSDIGGKFKSEVISFVSDPLYDVDRTAKSFLPTPAPILERSSRKRKNRPDDDDNNREKTPADDVPHVPADDPVVALGAKYPTSVLPDHDSNPLIRHTSAVRVNQFNWRDESNALIPPWMYKKVLVPGTVVLLAVSPKMWTIEPNRNNRKQSLTFQPVIRTLRVLRPSASPFDDSETAPSASVSSASTCDQQAIDDDFAKIVPARSQASSSRLPSLPPADIYMDLPGLEPVSDDDDEEAAKKKKKADRKKSDGDKRTRGRKGHSVNDMED